MHRLILTGPYAGKTIKLNGCTFEKGVLELRGKAEAVEGLVTYMGRSYQAYLEGSDELKAAQKRDAERLEKVNGERDNSRSIQPEKGSDPGKGQVQPEGQGTASQTNNGRSGAVKTEKGSEGGVSSGDGHENAGLSQAAGGQNRSLPETTDLALQKAVLALDSKNNEHWTTGGKPAISAVEQAYGSTGITRKDINAVAPGWDRAKAKEASELAEING